MTLEGFTRPMDKPVAALAYCERLEKGDCDDTDKCRAYGCRWIEKPAAAQRPPFYANKRWGRGRLAQLRVRLRCWRFGHVWGPPREGVQRCGRGRGGLRFV